jgi:vacuolar protein sorting-associated protein 54
MYNIGVLNDPGKRSVQPPKARKAEIPPVSHASIPKVKSSDFDSYINYISNVYQRYHQNKMQGTEGLPNISSTDTQFSTLPPLLEDGHDKSNESIPEVGRNPYGIPNIISLENLDDLELSPNLQSQEYDMPMLENVPSIFFEPNFQLENPRIFDVVCEGADIVGHSGPNPPTSTNSILQEKLSHYLDTVEVHLIQEISKRSAQFFEALSNLQALHQETLDCVSQIHSIRQNMKETQQQQCESGLKVVSLQRRRTNIGLLYNGIQMVKEIRSSQPMIQILLNQGDFFAALDLIDDAKSKLSGSDATDYEDDRGDASAKQDTIVVRRPHIENSKLLPKLDMQAVRALLNFSSQLDEMYVAVGNIMEHDFISSLISDFTMYMDGLDMDAASHEILVSVLTSATSRTYGSVRSPSMLETTRSKDFDLLKDRIAPATMGLVRSKQVKRSLHIYRERLLSELKTSITKVCPV